MSNQKHRITISSDSNDSTHLSSVFEPTPLIILKGDIVTWVNNDNHNHAIHSVQIGTETDLMNTGLILPHDEVSITLNTVARRIDYICSIHPQEKGYILIPDKRIEEMNNKENFEFLSDAYEIKPPEILSHLDSEHRISREKALEGFEINNNTLVRHFDPELFEILIKANESSLKNKTLVIVFWDISGFSALCNNFINAPLIIVDLLSMYFDAANNIIHQNQGMIDKFVGDGIMAYFGYNTNNLQEMATTAMKAAVELKERFVEILIKWQKRYEREYPNILQDCIHLKCGIHIGEVLFGQIKTSFRDQITVIGSNVNFASRLEDKAEDDQILVSQELFDKVNTQFVFEVKIHDIKAYGKVKTYIYMEMK